MQTMNFHSLIEEVMSLAMASASNKPDPRRWREEIRHGIQKQNKTKQTFRDHFTSEGLALHLFFIHRGVDISRVNQRNLIEK